MKMSKEELEAKKLDEKSTYMLKAKKLCDNEMERISVKEGYDIGWDLASKYKTKEFIDQLEIITSYCQSSDSYWEKIGELIMKLEEDLNNK